MKFDLIKEVIHHALIDSLKVLGFIFIVYVILSFLEVKITSKIKKENKLSPLFGSLFGLIPQCGVSVVASDLYIKQHITLGTLMGIFLSCSDEAIPLMIAEFNDKSLYTIPLVIIKFVIGFVIGFIVDIIIKDKKHVHNHLEHCEHEEEVHVGCCNHDIDNEHESKLHQYLIHPLKHSLKIFIYVFIINIFFGSIIELIGEDNLSNFLLSNRYLSPLFSTIIGIIPNCASSVVLTELFMIEQISFGAMLGGLLMNSGLGLVILLKDRKNVKKNILIIGSLFIISILISYITCLISGF